MSNRHWQTAGKGDGPHCAFRTLSRWRGISCRRSSSMRCRTACHVLRETPISANNLSALLRCRSCDSDTCSCASVRRLTASIKAGRAAAPYPFRAASAVFRLASSLSASTSTGIASGRLFMGRASLTPDHHPRKLRARRYCLSYRPNPARRMVRGRSSPPAPAAMTGCRHAGR